MSDKLARAYFNYAQPIYDQTLMGHGNTALADTVVVLFKKEHWARLYSVCMIEQTDPWALFVDVDMITNKIATDRICHVTPSGWAYEYDRKKMIRQLSVFNTDKAKLVRIDNNSDYEFFIDSPTEKLGRKLKLDFTE